MTGNPRLWSLMCLIALLVCQRGNSSDEGTVLQRVEATLAPGASFVDLTFNGNVKASSAEKVSLYSLGDGTDETVLSALPAEGLGGRPRMLRVFFSGNPPVGHAKLRACLGSIEVAGTLQHNICGEGRIVRDAAAEYARVVQSLQALPKVQGEKALSVGGFLGRSGGSEVGAADVNLVRGDFGSNDLNYFLRLKRGSLAGMDPRNMEAGANYSRKFLLHRKQRTELARSLKAPGGANEATALIEKLQRNWFAGHIVEAGVKLESDAAGERQWLGLVDAGWSLQSTTRRVKLPGAPGWFRFRWLAGGVEAGRNRARVKMGADAALLVRARGGAAPIRRLEFHARTINRWLARPEFGERGIRPWLQADAKCFLFESARVRYGVRFSVQRGSLPPVYAPVNNVQFGFIVESTEGGE